jgi:hypothetical protein
MVKRQEKIKAETYENSDPGIFEILMNHHKDDADPR